MMMSQRFLAIVGVLFIACLGMTSSGAAVLPSYDHYSNWFIACDNGLRCEARGMTDKHRGPHLSIRREAGPAGAVDITIAAPFRFEVTDLAMDGVALDLGNSAQIERHNSRTLLKISESPTVMTFVQQIRNGDFLEFRDQGNRIPLAGLTAALLRMDERQQRLGTKTAFIRRGNLAAARVPPPPALPRVQTGQPAPGLSPEEEQLLLESVQAFHVDPLDRNCYGAMHLMTPVKARVWPLDEHRALVAVPCTLTNIQQVQSFVYIADREEGGTIQLFRPELRFESAPQPIVLHTLPEPDFDPASGRLFASRKFLGDATCGYAGEWQWQDGEFVLARFTRQNHCGGSALGDWPVVYRARS